MKLFRYAAPVVLGLVAVILLLLFALFVWVGVLVIVDPSYGDPTTIIFIPFGLPFLAGPGFALAWAAFKTWPR
jgi:TRAP-type C4-dicarboxylate transport system permease small subunit